MKVGMGSKVKDTITGFAGVVTAVCKYMNGCVQYEITADRLVGHKMLPPVWMDEQRMVLRGTTKRAVKPRKKKEVLYPTGGPASSPSALNHPPSSHEESIDSLSG